MDLTIDRLETVIIDVPLRRPHRFARVTMAAQPVLLKDIPLKSGSCIAGGSEEPGGPGQIEKKGPCLQRFPRRRITLHDLDQRMLSLEEAGRAGGKNMEVGTELDGMVNRHPRLHTFAAGFRRDFMEQSSRLIERSGPDRPLPKQGIGEAGKGNLQRGNGEADDLAIHGRTMCDLVSVLVMCD